MPTLLWSIHLCNSWTLRTTDLFSCSHPSWLDSYLERILRSLASRVPECALIVNGVAGIVLLQATMLCSELSSCHLLHTPLVLQVWAFVFTACCNVLITFLNCTVWQGSLLHCELSHSHSCHSIICVNVSTSEYWRDTFNAFPSDGPICIKVQINSSNGWAALFAWLTLNNLLGALSWIEIYRRAENISWESFQSFLEKV